MYLNDLKTKTMKIKIFKYLAIAFLSFQFMAVNAQTTSVEVSTTDRKEVKDFDMILTTSYTDEEVLKLASPYAESMDIAIATTKQGIQVKMNRKSDKYDFVMMAQRFLYAVKAEKVVYDGVDIEVDQFANLFRDE